ncbi:hypothetical protein GW17_00043716 [Ensete ventricosum]|nr:hypothetical protein GW17_00043716 [Ensete ventricosum]
MGGGSTMRTGPLKRGTGGADEVDPVFPHPVVDCGFGFGFGFLHKIRDNCIVSYLYPTHGSRKIKQGASILDKWLEYKGFPIRGHTKGHDDECHLVSMFVKRGGYSSASSTRTAPYAGSGQRRGGNGENTKRMLQLQRPYRSLSIWRLTSLLFLVFTISNVPPAFTSMLRSLLSNSHHHRLNDFHHLVRWYPLLASPALLLAVYITCFH